MNVAMDRARSRSAGSPDMASARPTCIQASTASARVTLACAVTGSGPKLVRAGTWMSHLECELNEPDSWATLEALGRHHTVVRYDPRGCGLSTRQTGRLDFDTLLADFEVVMDELAPEPVALLGVSCGAAVAIAYAARHPGRVTALVIVNGFGRAYFSAASTSPHLLEEAKLLLAAARQKTRRLRMSRL